MGAKNWKWLLFQIQSLISYGTVAFSENTQTNLVLDCPGDRGLDAIQISSSLFCITLGYTKTFRLHLISLNLAATA